MKRRDPAKRNAHGSSSRGRARSAAASVPRAKSMDELPGKRIGVAKGKFILPDAIDADDDAVAALFTGADAAERATNMSDEQPSDSDTGTRAAFIAGLVKMIEDMLPEGRAEATGFDSAKWVAQWLDCPQPALAGKTPTAYLDTADGRAIVRRLLGAIGSGAYV